MPSCDSCGRRVDHLHSQMTFAGEGDFGHCCVGGDEAACGDYVGGAS